MRLAAQIGRETDSKKADEIKAKITSLEKQKNSVPRIPAVTPASRSNSPSTVMTGK